MRGTVVIALVMVSLARGGQVESSEQIARTSRFMLFSDCRPMAYDIVLNLTETDLDITENSIRTVVVDRLRIARLFSPKDTSIRKSGILHIDVSTAGRAFAVGVSYTKPLYDPASGETSHAISWRDGTIGMHGGSIEDAAVYIRSVVSEKVDKFLVEYLRVNEKACEAQLR